MKKSIMGAFLAVVMVVTNILPVFADAPTVITWGDDTQEESTAQVNTDDVYLALGADLSNDQLATVLTLMGLAGQDVSQFNVVYITNADEKQYLGNYVDASVIGSRALSSVLVRPAEEGHGVVVTTKNINYCTEGMYRNALLTAGVKNADITVVGPSPISGTAALIGALKAYENMSGKDVTEQSIDTALNELVTTGEIADETGDSEEVAELIAFIKAEIAGKELNTQEEIEEAVRKAAQDYGTTLTDEEVDKIVDLMVKIKALGLDYDTLLDQAQDLYEKYGDDFKSGKLSIDDLGSISKGEIIKNVVGNFFTGIFDGIAGIFKGILGKK